MKALIVALVTFWAVMSHAQAGYEISKVNSAKTRAIIKGDMKNIGVGNVLEFTDEFSEACRGKVIRMKKDSAILDMSSCKNKDAIKAGVFMTPTDAEIASDDYMMNKEPKSGKIRSAGLPSANESWYTLWGLGFSRVSYQDELQDLIDLLEDIPGVDRTTVNVDFLGFFWPDASYKTMYGVIINGVNDSFSAPGGDVSLLQYTLGFSVHHFYGANIGDGWFIRGDIGPAWFVLDVDSSIDFSEDSDIGLGLMVGGGYSFVIGEETRMPLGLYLAYRTADDLEVATINFTLGFLF